MWADRHSGRTSKCEMRADLWCHGSSKSSPAPGRKRPPNAVLAPESLLVHSICVSKSPEGQGGRGPKGE